MTWDIGDVGCWGFEMLGMWDVGDVQDVGCWGCGMLETWDVREVGCSGCGMLIYKMPFLDKAAWFLHLHPSVLHDL